jgi:hypothetical protein
MPVSFQGGRLLLGSPSGCQTGYLSGCEAHCVVDTLHAVCAYIYAAPFYL